MTAAPVTGTIREERLHGRFFCVVVTWMVVRCMVVSKRSATFLVVAQVRPLVVVVVVVVRVDLAVKTGVWTLIDHWTVVAEMILDSSCTGNRCT